MFSYLIFFNLSCKFAPIGGLHLNAIGKKKGYSFQAIVNCILIKTQKFKVHANMRPHLKILEVVPGRFSHA